MYRYAAGITLTHLRNLFLLSRCHCHPRVQPQRHHGVTEVGAHAAGTDVSYAARSPAETQAARDAAMRQARSFSFRSLHLQVPGCATRAAVGVRRSAADCGAGDSRDTCRSASGKGRGLPVNQSAHLSTRCADRRKLDRCDRLPMLG